MVSPQARILPFQKKWSSHRIFTIRYWINLLHLQTSWQLLSLHKLCLNLKVFKEVETFLKLDIKYSDEGTGHSHLPMLWNPKTQHSYNICHWITFCSLTLVFLSVTIIHAFFWSLDVYYIRAILWKCVEVNINIDNVQMKGYNNFSCEIHSFYYQVRCLFDRHFVFFANCKTGE